MTGDSLLPQRTAKLPAPDVYEQEYRFWPWGKLLDWVARWVAQNAPRSSHVVDYMCGTGYLLNAIRSNRADLSVEGWDISAEYIAYGKEKYPDIQLHHGNALNARLQRFPNTVICTAGIHHLVDDQKKRFITKVESELLSDGWFIVGEEVLSSFSEQNERRRGVIELHTALLDYVIDQDAPTPVIEAACDVFANDMLERGEFKISVGTLKQMLMRAFTIEFEQTIWPEASTTPFGDIVLVCRPKK